MQRVGIDEGRRWPGRLSDLHPAVARALNRRISGDPERSFWELLVDLLPSLGLTLPVARAASLGCGRGELDRRLARLGITPRLVGYDDAAEVRDAGRLARGAGLPGLRYHSADLDLLSLPRASFELVVARMAFQRTTHLEELCDTVADALAPGGLLVLDEYVGPTCFRWTRAQAEAVDDVLAGLPPRHRSTREGTFKTSIDRPRMASPLARDRGAAARSADVLACVEERFEILWRRPYGGSLLSPLLDGIAWTFGDGDPDAEDLLAEIVAVEDRLIASGELADDFVVMVARPR